MSQLVLKIGLHRIEPLFLFIPEKQPNDVYMMVRHDMDGDRAVCVRRFFRLREEDEWRSTNGPEENFNIYSEGTLVDVVLHVEKVKVEEALPKPEKVV